MNKRSRNNTTISDYNQSFYIFEKWVCLTHSPRLPNFPRAMAIKLRALENEIPWSSGYSRPHHSFAEGRVFNFQKSRSLENAFLGMWFAPIHQCKYGDIRSFFCNLKEQNYLVLPFHKTKST